MCLLLSPPTHSSLNYKGEWGSLSPVLETRGRENTIGCCQGLLLYCQAKATLFESFVLDRAQLSMKMVTRFYRGKVDFRVTRIFYFPAPFFFFLHFKVRALLIWMISSFLGDSMLISSTNSLQVPTFRRICNLICREFKYFA